MSDPMLRAYSVRPKRSPEHRHVGRTVWEGPTEAHGSPRCSRSALGRRTSGAAGASEPARASVLQYVLRPQPADASGVLRRVPAHTAGPPGADAP